MKEVQDTVNEYIESQGITFELVARNSDGEVIAKYTDSNSAMDVASYAGLMDERIMEDALDNERDKAEYIAESIAEDQMYEMAEAR